VRLHRPPVALGALAGLGCLLLVALFQGGRATTAGLAGAKAKQPLSFIPNRGQADKAVRYYAESTDFGAYRNLWPGIDLTFRSAAGKLRYAFLVRVVPTRRRSG
jgi:hypothetical protein